MCKKMNVDRTCSDHWGVRCIAVPLDQCVPILSERKEAKLQ